MSDSALQEAKRRLILPALLPQLGLGHLAKKSARCPFHDDQRNSFSVFKGESGAWFWKCHAGCGQGDEITFLEKHKGVSTGEAIRLFREMAGCAPVSTPKRERVTVSNQATNGFDWSACVSALNDTHLERLGNERWFSGAFCQWLHESNLVGLYQGRISFPNGNGKITNAHVWFGGKDWKHLPPGNPVAPFIIGDLAKAKQVHIGESQWDMLSIADKTDWYENNDVAFISTRGKGNAKLVQGLIPEGASVCAWPQNDKQGQEWLDDLSTIVPKLGVARVPSSITKRNEFGELAEIKLKDANEWTNAGASAADLYQAFWRNELFKPVSIEQSPIAPPVESVKQPVPSAKLQGSEVTLPDVEPWPEAVNGAEVLNEMAETFSRYCALPEGAKEILALWCAYTHGFEAFQCSPRLYVTSPEKGCGETTLRDVIALFVPRSLPTENVSVAVLFRLVEKYKPVVLADECDAWLRDNEELRGLLNAGHRRGGMVYRCEGEGNEVRGFHVFAPVVLCGISKNNTKLPETLLDRSIIIRLDRAAKGELQARFNSDRVEKETEMCRKIARFIADNKARYKTCDPVLPEGVYNRLADNWRPLFAVAEIAAGEWPARAEAAFRSLVRTGDIDAQSLGVTLLSDIREVFDGEEMLSRRLIERLSAREESPWKCYDHGKEITMRQLANLLKPYGVHPRDVRLSGEHGRGYRLADFQKPFRSYLTPPSAF